MTPLFAEHGTPRIDTSEYVWFSNDQLAVKFIEEIDFDYCAANATSTLMTAESYKTTGEAPCFSGPLPTLFTFLTLHT